MFEILNVVERVGRGESRSALGRVTGFTRKTITVYVATAVGLGWRPGVPPSEALAREVYRLHRPRRDRGPGESESLLLEQRERIQQWLRPGPAGEGALQLTKVHGKLAQEGVVVP